MFLGIPENRETRKPTIWLRKVLLAIPIIKFRANLKRTSQKYKTHFVKKFATWLEIAIYCNFDLMLNGPCALKIISCSSHPELTASIADLLGQKVAKTSISKLPNGEVLISIGESLRDQDVYIVQTGFGSINDMLMELLIMITGCKSASARRVTVGTTYCYFLDSLRPYIHSCPMFSLRKAGQKRPWQMSDHSQTSGKSH